MNIYLVDFENVNETALIGIKNLKSDDSVFIFHGEQLKSISLEITKEMVDSKATIEFLSTHKTGKNYLDFQLSTYLGYLIAKSKKANYFIISKDSGFDSVIDFWKNRKVSLTKQDSIVKNNNKSTQKTDSNNSNNQQNNTKTKESKKDILPKPLSETYKNKVKTAISNNKLSSIISDKDFEIIFNAILKSNSKVKLNNNLMKELGSEKTILVYNHIKSIFEEYIEQQSQAKN